MFAGQESAEARGFTLVLASAAESHYVWPWVFAALHFIGDGSGEMAREGRSGTRLALLAEPHVGGKMDWLSRCTLEVHPHACDGSRRFGTSPLRTRCLTGHSCDYVIRLILQVSDAGLATRGGHIKGKLERPIAIVSRQIDERGRDMVLRRLRSENESTIASARQYVLRVRPVAYTVGVLFEIDIGPLAK